MGLYDTLLFWINFEKGFKMQWFAKPFIKWNVL